MEMDFLDVARELLDDPSMLDSFQFYLFDGPHAMADQYGTPAARFSDNQILNSDAGPEKLSPSLRTKPEKLCSCVQGDTSLSLTSTHVPTPISPLSVCNGSAAITYYYPLLAETSVVIVDDWNVEEIRVRANHQSRRQD